MQDDDLEDIEQNMEQIGSPYFTHAMHLQE